MVKKSLAKYVSFPLNGRLAQIKVKLPLETSDIRTDFRRAHSALGMMMIVYSFSMRTIFLCNIIYAFGSQSIKIFLRANNA